MNHLVPLSVILTATLMVPAGARADPSEHPVELVAGSCAEPGSPVVSLAPVRADDAFAAPPAAMAGVIEALGAPVMRGQGTVSAEFAEIVATDHAVRVLDPAGGEAIACGEFGGVDQVVADLHVGLVGMEMSGVAWLHDNGDGKIETAIVLVSSTPVAQAGVDGHVEVAISKSRYLPSPLEIDAGTTVTWVNEDALPHTATATTPEVHFDSGYMALDDAFAYTFDAPGEYPYYCVFHPRMRAVVVVR